MYSALAEFREGLGSLKNYLDYLDQVERLLSGDNRNIVDGDAKLLLDSISAHPVGVTRRRQLNYTTIVISIYGYFEHLMEEIIGEHIQELNSIVPSYTEFPEKFQQTHLYQSYELLKSLGVSRKLRDRYDQQSIIANLNSCLSGTEGFRINHHAFSLHSRNFRCEGIAEVLARVGVEENTVAKIVETTRLKEFLESRGESVSDAEQYINDLAERRNEVSHGIPTDILALSELERYLEFFDEFSQALESTLLREALPLRAKHKAICLGNPIAVFNNNIVGIPIKTIRVREGDFLIAERSQARLPFVGGRIEEIQVDGIRFKEIEPSDKTNVALRVDFNVKVTHTIYVVQC